MEKILTKAEIEALLNAVFDGRIEPERELAKAEGLVVSYDLFNTEAHKLTAVLASCMTRPMVMKP